MRILTRVITDFSKLLEIEDFWNELINKTSENPFFLTGFLKQFMDFYRSNGWTPLVLVISVDEMIGGIAPLMTKKKFGVRFVKFLSESWFSPDFIADDRYRKICIGLTLDFLFKTFRCQFVDLTLPAESPSLQILKQMCKAKKIYFCTKRWRWADMGHTIIPISHSWHEFTKLRGYNFRRRFEKRLKQNLNRAGSWKIICIGNEDKESAVIEKILNVERMSWKHLWRTRRGMGTDQDLLMIWNGAQYMARIEPNFKWSVWFLELNEQTIAYALVLQYKKVAFIVKTSYDKRYKKLQPGIYINNEAIRDLFNKRQVGKIDYLTDLPFHRNWTSICLPRVKVMMSRRGIVPIIMGYVFASEYTRNIVESIPETLSKKMPLIPYLKNL